MTQRELLQVARARRLATNGEARRLRVSAGLSIDEVAGAVGASKSAIWRWESGKRAPRGAAAAAWGALLEQLAGQVAA